MCLFSEQNAPEEKHGFICFAALNQMTAYGIPIRKLFNKPLILRSHISLGSI
jgi:hypothetical protein